MQALLTDQARLVMLIGLGGLLWALGVAHSALLLSQQF